MFHRVALLLLFALGACSKEEPKKSDSTAKAHDDESPSKPEKKKKPKAAAAEDPEPKKEPEPVASSEPTKKGVELVSYFNPRFGFSVGAPKWLVAQPEPTNGDGRTWKAKDVEMGR